MGEESYQVGNLDLEILGISDASLKSISSATSRLNRLSRAVERINKTKLNGGIFDRISNLLGGKSSKTSKSSNIFGLFGNAFSFYTAVRVGKVIAQIAQSGAEYTETLNLWQVAMGDNLTLATQFVNKMNEAYGVSEKTLMNAQAIFKNMLGSLGQISDTTAYALSEGITQMALDYASLYNVNFQQAFSKFQAALAGQVRPIRSVAGYDITETTLFQLYQSLGGTKTMRQLTRTEKQLLSILSIFNQMGRSGAIGDLSKTMESFANQTRIMAEAWNEATTYAGILLTYAIQQSGALTYLNAALLFAGDVLKAVANELGAIQSFGDPFASVNEGLGLSIDAADELNGKLADFDKFRTLTSSTENALGLDSKLVEALSSYTSILDNATMKARELATAFGQMTGLFDKDGNFNPDKWKEFSAILDTVGVTLTTVFGAWLGVSIIKFFVSPLGLAVTAITTLTLGIGKFISAWDNMSVLSRTLAIIGSLCAGITATAVALKLLQGNWAGALAIGGIVTGAWIGTAATLSQMSNSTTSTLPDTAIAFGGSNVSSVGAYQSSQNGVGIGTQMAQANYDSTVKALSDWWGGANARNDVPQLTDANPTGLYQTVTGVANAQGNTWTRTR